MRLFFLFVFAIAFVQSAPAQSLNKLPKLNIDKSNITVSGVSAGGFMAVQLHVALSSVFKGAASVAGGVYWCSEGNALTAQLKCMKNPGSISADNYVRRAMSEAKTNQIEKLENLKTSKVYIYASQKDAVIKSESSDRLYEFYSKFVPKAQIAYEKRIPSGHGWISNSYGNACDAQATPWINNCKYDQAGEILKQFYGQLNVSRAPKGSLRAQLYPYDQKEFQTQNSALYDYGYVYVPQGCLAKRSMCRLHVALHGCQQNPDYVQDLFATNSGFNSWAEANNIVVLYPQVAKVSQVNPYACWDWFGYTGRDFANRNGTQIIAIQKMVYRLMGNF